jgi:mono/diheme cytochrome c family protein
MRYGIPGFLLVFLFASLSVAQTSQPGLNDIQQHGRRLFQQRCAVCHTPPMVISKPYGPLLNVGNVLGREDSVRTTIQEGETGLMPGFKYGLEPSEIDAIIKYLKTVEKPSQPTTNWVSAH